MPGEIARQWFVSGEGIDRHVISADIQRYLGNDATVRPGDNQGVQGFWIKAYRNLTSAMISDLRADSVRWRQEQRVTGNRGSNSPVPFDKSGFTVPDPLLDYPSSRTFEVSSAGRAAQRREGDSPSIDPYAAPPQRSRNQGSQMDIDPQPVARTDPRYGQPSQPTRGGGYPPENGAYPPQSRDRFQEPGRSQYPPDQPMQDVYARAPVTAPYGNDPRYAPNYPDPNPGMPPGYGGYMPATTGFGQQPVMAPTRGDPQQYPPQVFGQPQVPPSRDSREQRDHRDPRDPRDPRYAGQAEYDPRYAYPSPATTVSSVAPREREPISSPQQPGPYGAGPLQYDQYGRPVQQPPQGIYGSSDSGYPPPSRDPNYGRERQPAAPSSSDRERDANRRRRLH